MRRREFITLLGGAAAIWPYAAAAELAERMRRIGVLLPAGADDTEFQARVARGVRRELGPAGRQATGFMTYEYSIGAKWLQLLRHALLGRQSFAI